MPIDIKKARAFMEADSKHRQALGLYQKTDGKDFFLIKDDGEYEIRILEMEQFLVGLHWGIIEGKEGRNGGTIKCPAAFDGSDCPVCELVETMLNSEDPKERKQAEEWQVQIKYPMLIVDLNEEGGKKVPRVYEAPKTVYQGALKWILNVKYGDITDFETGRNVTIVRSKDGKGITKYEVQPDPGESPAGVDVEKLPKLLDLCKPRSYKDIEYALNHGEYPPREEVKEAKPTLKKPTAYDKGLPQTKTRDEEPPEEEETEEAAPPRKILGNPRLSARKTVEPEEALPEEEEKPVAKVNVPATGKISVKDRLAALKARRAS